LADVVSKNGNLLLSIPQRGDGTIDSEEEKILDDLAGWMAVNGQAVFGSRPWHIYGEGPTVLSVGMQNEGGFKGFVEGDVRFTVKDGALYLYSLVAPGKPLSVKALGRRAMAQAGKGQVAKVTLLGGGAVRFRQREDAMEIDLPRGLGVVPVLKIEGRGVA
jgi:alpha-L-fucosidase